MMLYDDETRYEMWNVILACPNEIRTKLEITKAWKGVMLFVKNEDELKKYEAAKPEDSICIDALNENIIQMKYYIDTMGTSETLTFEVKESEKAVVIENIFYYLFEDSYIDMDFLDIKELLQGRCKVFSRSFLGKGENNSLAEWVLDLNIDDDFVIMITGDADLEDIIKQISELDVGLLTKDVTSAISFNYHRHYGEGTYKVAFLHKA